MNGKIFIKKILVGLFVMLGTLCCTYIPAQSWIWGREVHPGKSGGLGEGFNDHDIAVDAQGNVYIAGWVADSVSFGPYQLYNNSYLVKYDLNGNVIWADGLTDFASILSVGLDARKNIYITGFVGATAIIGHDTLKAPNVSGLCFLAKLDSNGTVIWAKQSRGANIMNSYSWGTSLAVDNMGNVLIAGYFGDTVSFGADTLRSTSSSGNTCIVKYDSSGNELWARQSTQAPGNNSYGHSIAVDKWGNAFLTGSFYDSVTFGKYRLTGEQAYVVKYNSGGKLLWAVQSKPNYIAGNYASGTSISVDYYGNAYATGYFRGSIRWGGDTINDIFGTSLYVTKLDSSGNPIWVKAANNYGNNWKGQSLICDTTSQAGMFLLANIDLGGIPPFEISFGNDTFKLKTNHQSADVLIHFDSAGNVICGSIISEGDEDDGGSVGVDYSGRYVYITGDLYDTTIFATDTLIYGHDIPFVARWHPCTESPLGISIASSINSSECAANGSAIAQTATGGTPPYKYKWAPGGGTNLTASHLSAGTYTITVTDNNNVTATSSVTITQPNALTVVTHTKPDYGNGDGAAWVNVSGGTRPYTYLWNPTFNSTDSITGQFTGKYCCTITDANGCSDTVCVTIILAGINSITSSSGLITIYPNPGNGEFTIQSSVVSGKSSVEVYNTLGQLVFSEWSIIHYPLSINLSNQPNGVYFYRVLNEDGLASGELMGEGKLVIEK